MAISPVNTVHAPCAVLAATVHPGRIQLLLVPPAQPHLPVVLGHPCGTHSPRHFYLSGAYRLGWTGPLTGGFLFFTPLFLLGFNPASVVAVIGQNLLYQYWLHTELIGRLGWFDRVFNSPANHRVHHAADAITWIKILAAY